MDGQQDQEVYEYYTYQVYAQNDQEVDPIFWGQVMGTGISGGPEPETSLGVLEEQSGANDSGNPTSSAAVDLDPPPPPPTMMPRKRKALSPVNPEDPTDPRTRLAKEPGSPRTEAARRRNAAAVRRFRERKALEKGKRPDILDEQFRKEFQTREDVLEGTWGDVGNKGLVGEAPECWDEYMEAVRVLRRMGKEDEEEAKKAQGLTTAEMMIVKSVLARK